MTEFDEKYASDNTVMNYFLNPFPIIYIQKIADSLEEQLIKMLEGFAYLRIMLGFGKSALIGIYCVPNSNASDWDGTTELMKKSY